MEIEATPVRFTASFSARLLLTRIDRDQRLATAGLLIAFGIIAFATTTSSEQLTRTLLILLAAIGALIAGLSISAALGSRRWDSWIDLSSTCAASCVSLIALIALTSESENRNLTIAVLATSGCGAIWTLAVLQATGRPNSFGPDAMLGIIASAVVGSALLLDPELDSARGILLASISLLVASLFLSQSTARSVLLVATGASTLAHVFADSLPDGWLLLFGGGAALAWLVVHVKDNPETGPSVGVSRLSGTLIASTIVALGIASMASSERATEILAITSLVVTVVAVLFVQRFVVLDRGDRIALLNTRHQQLIDLARLDSLTRLPNRAALDARLEEELERAVRYRQPMSICFIDVDHFKSINDSLGHPTGDQVLRRIAELIRCTIRTPDFVARYGGEEFIVIAPGTWTQDASILGKRIQKAIQDWDPGLTERALTVSVGIAGVPEHGTDATELLKLADQALYTAKYAGRNRVEIAANSASSTPS